MKNKKTLYYLIPINLIVWGFVLYRIITFGNNTPHENVNFSAPLITNTKLAVTPDTFHLLLNYSDPFLKKNKITAYKQGSITKKENSSYQKEKKSESPKIKNEILWPDIIFRGMVHNRKTGKTIALVFIEGNELSMQTGEKYKQIKLLHIYTDSIKVEMNKKIRFIRK